MPVVNAAFAVFVWVSDNSSLQVPLFVLTERDRCGFSES